MGTVLQTIEIKNEFVEEEVAFAMKIDNGVDMRSESLESIAEEEVEDEELLLRMEDTSLYPMNESSPFARDQLNSPLQRSSPFNTSTDPLENSRKAAVQNKGKHPATFECPLCPKRCTRAYNLRAYLRTHSDERPLSARCVEKLSKYNMIGIGMKKTRMETNCHLSAQASSRAAGSGDVIAVSPKRML